jgi:hypothetical protein
VEDSGVLLLAVVVALDAFVVVLVAAVEEVVGFGVVTEPPDGVVLGGLSHSGCE